MPRETPALPVPVPQTPDTPVRPPRCFRTDVCIILDVIHRIGFFVSSCIFVNQQELNSSNERSDWQKKTQDVATRTYTP